MASLLETAKGITNMVKDNIKNTVLGSIDKAMGTGNKSAPPLTGAAIVAANAVKKGNSAQSGGSASSGSTGSSGGMAKKGTSTGTSTGSSSSSVNKTGSSSGSSVVSGGSTSRSEYYNTRGDAAKEYQQWLNSQGAGLTVDGIWGKKTEAAYQKNKDAFNAWLEGKSSASGSASGNGGAATTTTAGINSGDLEALLKQYQDGAYTPQSDDELRAAAEAQYEAEYNANVLAAQQRNAAYQQSINQQIEALRQILAENQAATQKQYELSGNNMQRMLTARGLGRSSYAGDVAQNNIKNENEAMLRLMRDYSQSAGQLSSQGALYNQQTADTLSQLMRDKASNVTNAYNQLKSQEYERSKAAQDSYNQIVSNLQNMLSDRSLTQQQLAESIRQFNEQLAENKRQFNLSGK